MERTVDGEGNALGEDEAVGANEGGDLGLLVGLPVLLGDVVEVNVDDVEVKTVGLRNREHGGGARVVLKGRGQRYCSEALVEIGRRRDRGCLREW